MSTSDDVLLILNDQEIAGWTEVRITRGIERLPSDFEIGLTELYPSEMNAVVVTPGDSCRVQIGDDVVVTGYVDRYTPSYNANGHSIRITGRGKCQDLVDCSAEWKTSQMSSATAYTIASNLASAYSGLSVSCSVTDLLVVPQFNIMLGETAFEVIDRVCKYSGLLAYDGADGNLILARVGSTEHSTGLFEGENVLSASVEYSMDQRYQTYVGWLNAMVRIGANSFIDSNFEASGTDSGVLRNRKKFLIAEAVNGLQDLLQRRVNWEMNRRNGRSQVARVTVDSWRDGDGTLWTPNQLVMVYLPNLKLVDRDTKQAVKWTIGEVTFRRGEEGTQADLVLMDSSAFEVTPQALNYGLVNGADTQH